MADRNAFLPPAVRERYVKRYIEPYRHQRYGSTKWTRGTEANQSGPTKSARNVTKKIWKREPWDREGRGMHPWDESIPWPDDDGRY